jgi:hypothetical protein
MGKLSRMASGRRDWVEAVWAEAHDVPPGWPRLAWRAGGVGLIVRQELMIYRPGRAVLFTVAAAVAAWAAWPDSSAGHAAAGQFGVIATVLLLAGLPLLARRFLGPTSESRAGRFVRVGSYAAILALLPALAIIGVFAGAVPRQAAELRVFEEIQGPGVPGTSSGGPPWQGEIPILLLTAGYLAVLVWMTSRRSRVTGPTLAIGTGAGLVLGVVMYSVAPLGLSNDASNPWLPGSQVDPLVVLAWILLIGAPAAAALLAGWRRCRSPGRSVALAQARIGQGIAAGVLANLVGAMFVTVLGTGTTALMLKAAWLRHWLYHGELTGATVYRHELRASENVIAYFLICLAFPVIGLIMGSLAVACFMPVPRQSGPQPGNGGGGGGPGPEPAPDPPDGGRRTDADRDRVLVPV